MRAAASDTHVHTHVHAPLFEVGRSFPAANQSERFHMCCSGVKFLRCDVICSGSWYDVIGQGC